MTTPTIITFPSIANPSKIDWQLIRMDGKFESPLSGAVQQLSRPGARWQANFSWTTLSESDWHKLAAWWNQMTAANYRTALPNYAYQILGAAPATTVVYGGSQTGSSLKVCGLTAATGQFKTGDMLQFTDGTKHQLVMVTADMDASTMATAWASAHVYAAGTLITDGTHGQLVTTAGTSGALAPAWNATTGGTTTDNTVTWTNVGPLGYATVAITPALRISPTNGSAVTLTSPTARFMLGNNQSAFSFSPPRFSSASISLVEDILI